MIYEGKWNELILVNLDIVRDWGWADEYVKAMHLILNDDEPHDYIISTGKSYALYDFVKKTFDYLELNILPCYAKIQYNHCLLILLF